MSPHRLTLEQAADFLHIDASELNSLAVQGEIPCQRQGNRIFFDQDDLHAWSSQKIINDTNTGKKKTAKKKNTQVVNTPSISDYCSEELIETDIQAKTMPAVLKELVKLAEKSDYVYDPNDLYNELHERELAASTAIGVGVAVPHPNRIHQIELFSDSFICVAKLRQPIFFGSNGIRSDKTDIFFLICCTDSDLHLKLLSRICALCHETSLADDLRNATSTAEMMKIINSIDANPQLFPPPKES